MARESMREPLAKKAGPSTAIPVPFGNVYLRSG
jgi:hypothetical protein